MTGRPAARSRRQLRVASSLHPTRGYRARAVCSVLAFVVVASVVDAMAAETARRACAAEAAAMNPTFEPLACGPGPGRAVDEVAAVGLDCYARRAVDGPREYR